MQRPGLPGGCLADSNNVPIKRFQPRGVPYQMVRHTHALKSPTATEIGPSPATHAALRRSERAAGAPLTSIRGTSFRRQRDNPVCQLLPIIPVWVGVVALLCLLCLISWMIVRSR